jgi:hypothetical protein
MIEGCNEYSAHAYKINTLCRDETPTNLRLLVLRTIFHTFYGTNAADTRNYITATNISSSHAKFVTENIDTHLVNKEKLLKSKNLATQQGSDYAWQIPSNLQRYVTVPSDISEERNM